MVKLVYLISPHDSNGVPGNINVDPNGAENNTDLFTPLSAELLADVNEKLPERDPLPNKNPDWLQDSDLHITADSTTVDVTFVHEGAGYRNSIGYYIYETANPPRTLDQVKVLYVIFPNCSKTGSGGGLNPGDTVRLTSEVSQSLQSGMHVGTPTSYTFQSGQSIGWVLFVNAFRTYKQSMNHRGSKYYANHDFNPEKKSELHKYHTVLIQSDYDSNRIICGWEDLNRDGNSDDDFNDAVLIITPSSMANVDTSNINNVLKTEAKGTILCDDMILQAEYTNNDFSDCIVEYDMNKTFVDKKLTTLEMTFHLKHRSSFFDHTFGLVIPNLSSLNATIQRELFLGDATTSTIETLTTHLDHVPVFRSTKTWLPASGNHSHYANTHPDWDEDGVRTPASSAKITIQFHDDIDADALGSYPMPFKPYLKVYRSGSVDIDIDDSYTIYAFSEYPGTTRISNELSTIPKILILKDKMDYRCTHERFGMVEAFPNLSTHLESGGRDMPIWYMDNRERYLNPLLACPSRTWSI